MNTTHRSIWNAALGAWVAVSEITRACGKRSSAAAGVVLIGSSICSSVGAQAIIDGGTSVTQSSPWNTGGSLIVGKTGHGTLTVNTGATVSSSDGFLGYISGGMGVVTVTGVGSAWTNSGDLVVGFNSGGTGTLTAQDGGKVSNFYGILGFNSGAIGNITVTGAGSTWTNITGLTVGFNGTGTLTVQDGGKASNDFGFLGHSSSGIGNATVTGVGSAWTNSSTIDVGYNGTGTLRCRTAARSAIPLGASVLPLVPPAMPR